MLDRHPRSMPQRKKYPIWVVYWAITSEDAIRGFFPVLSSEEEEMDEDPTCPSLKSVHKVRESIADRHGYLPNQVTIISWQPLSKSIKNV